MKIELAEKVQALMNELEDLKYLKHGAYKTMEPECVIERRISTYDRRIAEIKKEIEAL